MVLVLELIDLRKPRIHLLLFGLQLVFDLEHLLLKCHFFGVVSVRNFVQVKFHPLELPVVLLLQLGLLFALSALDIDLSLDDFEFS